MSRSHHIRECAACAQAVRDARLFKDVQAAIADDTDIRVEQWSEEGGKKPEASLLGADVIPGYRICSELQRGGQGTVYRAVQVSTNRTVALKVLLPGGSEEERERRRFEREIDIVSTLQHPNIAKLYDSGDVRGHRFFAMELIEGESLASWIRRHSRPAWPGRQSHIDDVLHIAIMVCEGVGHAHRFGIVHRDLKPDNIVLDEELVPHVIDFGLAKPALAQTESVAGDHGVTQTGEFLGTIAYASPEQLTGNTRELDTRSDVYSLGVVLYEMLVGVLPYGSGASLIELLEQIRRGTVAPLRIQGRFIDRELETIVLKALARDPERRYDTAGALGRDLQRYRDGLPIEAKRDSTWYLAQKIVRRYRWAAAAFVLIICSICVSLAVSLWFWRQAVHDRDLARTARKNEAGLRAGAEAAERVSAFQAFVANTVAGELALRQHDVVDAWARLASVPDSMRRWEWYHLASQLDDSVARLSGHANYVEEVACFHGEQRAVSVSWDQTLRLWDLRRGSLLKTVALPTHGWAVDVSPGDAAVAVGDWAGTVHVFDPGSFEPTWRSELAGSNVTAVRFVSDSRLLATFVHEHNAAPRSTIQMIDLDAKRIVDQWEHAGHVDSIAVAPAGNVVAIAFHDRIEVRDLATGALKAVRKGRQAVAFDTTGTRLAYATSRESVVVLSLRDNATIVECVGHGGSIYDVRFTADGTKVVTASRDKTIRLWDASTAEPLATYVGHSWTITSLAITSDPRQFVSASWDGDVRLWSLTAPSRAVRVIQAHDGDVFGLDISPDGTRIATASGDGTAKIWEFGTGRLVVTLKGHDGPIQDAVFAPSGKLVATASWDHSVRVWDLADINHPRVLRGHKGRVHAVVFSPDEAKLYSGGADNLLCVWNLRDSSREQCIAAHDDHIHRLAVADQGRTLISAGHESIRVWDIERMRMLHRLDRLIMQDDFTLAIHPSGQTFAAGSTPHRIQSWGLSNYRPGTTYEGHTDEALALCYNPQGDRLVSCSLDGTVRLWDVTSGTQLIKLNTRHRLIRAVKFAPDGRAIVGATDSGELVIWESSKSNYLGKQQKERGTSQ